MVISREIADDRAGLRTPASRPPAGVVVRGTETRLVGRRLSSFARPSRLEKRERDGEPSLTIVMRFGQIACACEDGARTMAFVLLREASGRHFVGFAREFSGAGSIETAVNRWRTLRTVNGCDSLTSRIGRRSDVRASPSSAPLAKWAARQESPDIQRQQHSGPALGPIDRNKIDDVAVVGPLGEPTWLVRRRR